MKRLLTPLAAACLLASTSLPLHASPYSNLIVFGDSLSDAGWFTDADGSVRFTNRVGPTYRAGEAYGPVAPMLLGGQLGLGDAGLASANAGGNNWAVGGTAPIRFSTRSTISTCPVVVYVLTLTRSTTSPVAATTFSRGVSSVRPLHRLPPAVWSTA